MWKTSFDSATKTWRGATHPPLFHPNISIGQYVLWLLERNPKNIAQINDNNNVEVTNEELRIKAIRVAQNLEALGFKTNDIFGVIAKNHHDLTPVVLAAFCMGCPISALDPSFQKSEMMNILNITKPKLIFCDTSCYDTVKDSLVELGNNAIIFTFGGTVGASRSVEELFAETQHEHEYIAPNLDCINHIAVIICSSGTTGPSKGVCVSHAVLLNSANKYITLSDQDVMLYFSSLYWISGVTFLLVGLIQGATRVVTTESFSPEALLRIIEKRKVTMVFSSVVQVVLTLKCKAIKTTDLSSVKHYCCGGSKMSSNIVEEMNKYLPNGKTFVSYGLSELGEFAAINYPTPNNKSVGQLISGVVAKVIKEDGKRCGVGEDGEICLKGEYKSLAYYANQKASDELMDSENFILTGDIGHFDENRYLHIVDRKKDIFKYFSIHISPSEFEDVLVNHPGIASVCVVDVPDPTDVAPDLPAAVVIKSQQSQISEEEIHNIVAEKLPDTKRLVGGVYFVDKFPLTPSGKIMRREVKKIAVKHFQEKNPRK